MIGRSIQFSVFGFQYSGAGSRRPYASCGGGGTVGASLVDTRTVANGHCHKGMKQIMLDKK